MASKEDIEKLRDKIDIVDLISKYVHLEKSGVNYKGLSPFKDEKTPSFIVSPNKKIFKCFSSNIGGDAIKFYMLINNITFEKALAELSEKYDVNIKGIDKLKSSEYQHLYDIMKKVSQIYHEQLLKNEDALNYLYKRGYSLEDIKNFNLGYAPNLWTYLYDNLINEYSEQDLVELGLITIKDENKVFDFFRNRIIIPIYNKYGNIIAFGGRDITSSKNTAKYLNTKESKIFSKGKELYGIFDCGSSLKKDDYCILVEGYFDVLAIQKNGFKTAVASLGTALSDEQVKYILSYTKNIILSYDNDEAGKKACINAINLFNKYEVNIKVLNIFDSKDPDEYLKEYGREKFIELIKQSQDSFDFVYEYYSKNYDIQVPASKIKIINDLRPFFESIQSDIYFDIYKKRLSQNLDLSDNIINLRYTRKNVIKKNIIHKEKVSLKDDNIYSYEDYIILHLFKYKKDIDKFEKIIFKNDIYNDIYLKLKYNEPLSNDQLDEIHKLNIENLNNDSFFYAYKSWIYEYIDNTIDKIKQYAYSRELDNNERRQYFDILSIKRKIKEQTNIKEVEKYFSEYLNYEGRTK